MSCSTFDELWEPLREGDRVGEGSDSEADSVRTLTPFRGAFTRSFALVEYSAGGVSSVCGELYRFRGGSSLWWDHEGRFRYGEGFVLDVEDLTGGELREGGFLMLESRERAWTGADPPTFAPGTNLNGPL